MGKKDAKEKKKIVAAKIPVHVKNVTGDVVDQEWW